MVKFSFLLPMIGLSVGFLIQSGCAQSSSKQTSQLAYLSDLNGNAGPAIRLWDVSPQTPVKEREQQEARLLTGADIPTSSPSSSWSRSRLTARAAIHPADLAKTTSPTLLPSDISKIEFGLLDGESYDNENANILVTAVVAGAPVDWNLELFRRLPSGFFYGRNVSEDGDYGLIFRCQDADCRSSFLEITDRGSGEVVQVTARRRIDRAAFTPAAVELGSKLAPRSEDEKVLIDAARRKVPVERTEIEIEGGRTFTQLDVLPSESDDDDLAKVQPQKRRVVIESESSEGAMSAPPQRPRARPPEESRTQSQNEDNKREMIESRAKPAIPEPRGRPLDVLDNSVALVEIVPDDSQVVDTSIRPLKRPRDLKIVKVEPANPARVVADENLQFAWPVKMAVRITSHFGPRRGRMHEGLDIDGRTGDPIYASESGTVATARSSGNYGKMVVIEHGSNGRWTTLYAHLSVMSVRAGQWVEKGQLIGKMGTTGNARGDHLHFEIEDRGRAKNPVALLPPASSTRVASK